MGLLAPATTPIAVFAVATVAAVGVVWPIVVVGDGSARAMVATAAAVATAIATTSSAADTMCWRN